MGRETPPTFETRKVHIIMGAFQLPETLPQDVAGLEELRSQAGAEFDAIKAKVENGDSLTAEELGDLRSLAAAIDTLTSAVSDAHAAVEAHNAEVRSLIDATAGKLTPAVEETETIEPAAEVVAEAPVAVAAAAAKPVPARTSFAGVATSNTTTPVEKTPVGFEMSQNVPGYVKGLVGFSEVAKAMSKMAPGSTIRGNRAPISSRIRDLKTGKVATADFSHAMSFATLSRNLSDEQIIRSADEFLPKVEAAVSNTRAAKYDNGALVAAAGFCAPSETVYDFCDVTEDNDLLSLPEINIARGGLRYPNDPDMTDFYASLPFFYTSAQLDAEPTKPCVEIPCTDFEEITKNATGICITVGLLQEKNWPELVAKYLAEVMKAHMHDLQARSISAILTGSGAAVVMPAAETIGAAGSILNALAWNAVDIRVRERMGRRAKIEGFAPSWLLAIAQADLALQSGRDLKAVTEQDVDAWLAVRNISIQWVSDWQTRDDDLPGDPAGMPLSYPATVDVVLYPQGAWFRHVDNVIEVGNLYDKAQLQANTKTALFTEDEFAVGKRCRISRLVRVPLCVSGAIGAEQYVTCNTPAP